ncbi:MAG: alpha/beta hydrolase, partial [Promethearchaeota archaeon]
MMIRKNWFKTQHIKIAYYFSVILNSICVVLGIIYLSSPSYSILWDIFGFLLLTTIFANLILIFINSCTKIGKYNLNRKLHIFGYVYLAFIILAMVCMLLGNLLVSVTYSNQLIDNLFAYILIYFFYFGTLIIGIIYAVFGINFYNSVVLGLKPYYLEKRFSGKFIKTKKRLKKIMVVISKVTFIIGIIFGIGILFGSFEIVTTFISIVSGQFGVFFSIIFFANTILLLKLKHRKVNSKKFYRTAISGIVVSGLLLTPLFLTQYAINNIERNFSTTFGSNWEEKISNEANEYFLETPFSLSSYFLGITPKDCIIEKDTLFYNNEGIQLYFDAYMPIYSGENLPGGNSTIIRIHGGGWVSGDKGLMNMMQMNKYFAAQGYVVFDIQYGIAENPLYTLDPLTPVYKKGNFNIDDMMRHIGIFTNYLTDHAEEYGANLDSVFISGGSAGGHLTCAVALAIASGDYTDLFSTSLTIKGLIPFYPANGQMGFFGVSGSDEF